MAEHEQTLGDAAVGPSLQMGSRIRRLGRKVADHIRLAIGKETASGIAEANELERHVRELASRKDKPSIMDGTASGGKTDAKMTTRLGFNSNKQRSSQQTEQEIAGNAPDRIERKMAALGSSRHLEAYNAPPPKRGGRIFSEGDKVLLEEKLARSPSNASSLSSTSTLVSETNAHSSPQQLDKRRGMVVGKGGQKWLEARLAEAPPTTSLRSFKSSTSTLVSEAKPANQGIRFETAGRTATEASVTQQKGKANQIEIAPRNDRNRSRVGGR